MKVVALVSGGKDSCYNMQLCQSYGHEIVALANLLPLHDTVDELDSFMYQTVGHQVVAAFSQCMGLPLFRRRIQGLPRERSLRYNVTEGDEVEDLEVLLRAVKSHFPSLGGVSSGAIASDYQRLRVESVCSRLGLVSLAYMWRQEQASLLQNMIGSGMHAVLVKVAAMGLDPHKHLGKDLATLRPLLMKLQDLYGCNVCGEGGEYETLTLDCSLFKNAKIVLDEFTIQLHSPDTIAPVGVLHPVKFHLEYKSETKGPDLNLADVIFEIASDIVDGKASDIADGKHIPFQPTTDTPLIGTGRQEANMQAEIISIVKKQRHGLVAISCWLPADGQPLQGMQFELDSLLREIKRNLETEELSWADVLYVHLYLNDMADFAKANEIYNEHISEKDNLRGVPSRCCVELPLSETPIGHVFVEILAARDQSKKVLHVQSISSWAPCCIGPYSQGTHHQQLMYMAGQLGLDPPTMKLVSGGSACEMAQALKNCKAVAEAFTPTFFNSALSFIIYCSYAGCLKEMQKTEEVFDNVLRGGRDLGSCRRFAILPEPLVLYILLPALPKGALVEVAPLTYVSGSCFQNYSDVGEVCAPWEEVTMQSSTSEVTGPRERTLCKGLILQGRLCRAFVLLSYLTGNGQNFSGRSFNGQIALEEAFQFLFQTLSQASMDWDNVFVFRLYFVVEKVCFDDLRRALDGCRQANCPEPTLVPVLGVGEDSKLLDLIAMELTASGC